MVKQLGDKNSTQTTPAINDRSNNYQGNPSTREGVAPTTFLIFMSVPLALLLYCYQKGKLKPVPSDTPADQEVESPDDLEVESPVDLEIGPTQISKALSHSEDIPPPNESIILAVDSLPSYYDALAMPYRNGPMPVLLPAPSVNGFVPRQLSSGPISSLKSQVVYSKQPKLGLTQEFVVDCAHALWVVHSIRRLVSLMLLKWFLSDSFIYFMYRMFNENF